MATTVRVLVVLVAVALVASLVRGAAQQTAAPGDGEGRPTRLRGTAEERAAASERIRRARERVRPTSEPELECGEGGTGRYQADGRCAAVARPVSALFGDGESVAVTHMDISVPTASMRWLKSYGQRRLKTVSHGRYLWDETPFGKACAQRSLKDACTVHIDGVPVAGICADAFYQGEILCTSHEVVMSFAECRDGKLPGDACTVAYRGGVSAGVCGHDGEGRSMLCYTEGSSRFIDAMTRSGIAFPPVPANVTVGGRWYNANLRYRGGGSFLEPLRAEYARVPLAIDFGSHATEWRSSHAQPSDGHDASPFSDATRVLLANSFGDPTRLKVPLVTDMFRRMGLPVPRVSLVRVTLNGEDYGLYHAIEHAVDMLVRIQRESAERMGSTAESPLPCAQAVGALYEPNDDLSDFHPQYFVPRNRVAVASSRASPHTRAVAEAPSETAAIAWEGCLGDAWALWRATHDRQMEPRRVARKDRESFGGVDVSEVRFGDVFAAEEFAAALAVNVAVANGDSYGFAGHNFFLYKDACTNRLRFIPWDFDLTLERLPTTASLRDIDPKWVLVRAVTDNATLFDAYKRSLRTLVEEHFTDKVVAEVVDRWFAVMRPHVLSEDEDVTGIDKDAFVGGPARIKRIVSERRTALLSEMVDMDRGDVANDNARPRSTKRKP